MSQATDVINATLDKLGLKLPHELVEDESVGIVIITKTQIIFNPIAILDLTPDKLSLVLTHEYNHFIALTLRNITLQPRIVYDSLMNNQIENG